MPGWYVRGMKINANNVYSIPVLEGREYVLSLSGVFGGGTINLTFFDLAGGYGVPMDAAYKTHTGMASFVFVAPMSRLDIDLSGATTPDIVATCVLRPVGS